MGEDRCGCDDMPLAVAQFGLVIGDWGAEPCSTIAGERLRVSRIWQLNQAPFWNSKLGHIHVISCICVPSQMMQPSRQLLRQTFRAAFLSKTIGLSRIDVFGLG